METKRRHNAVVMLEMLLAGFPIKFKDDDGEYYYQNGLFGIRGKRYGPISVSKGDKELLLQCDLSLQDFIQLCEGMPYKEVYKMGCEMVLTLHNRKIGKVTGANP